MAKQNTKATKGNGKATGKASNSFASQPRKARPGVAAIEAAGGSNASLQIVSSPRMVVGGDSATKAEACLAMLRKARTVGDYMALRDKAGMGATIGGYLPGWVEKGFVKVGKGKASNAKPKATKTPKVASEPASEPATAA